jgi:hypothetical protein
VTRGPSSTFPPTLVGEEDDWHDVGEEEDGKWSWKGGMSENLKRRILVNTSVFMFSCPEWPPCGLEAGGAGGGDAAADATGAVSCCRA